MNTLDWEIKLDTEKVLTNKSSVRKKKKPISGLRLEYTQEGGKLRLCILYRQLQMHLHSVEYIAQINIHVGFIWKDIICEIKYLDGDKHQNCRFS